MAPAVQPCHSMTSPEFMPEIEARRRNVPGHATLRGKDVCSWPATTIWPSASTWEAERLATVQEINHLLVLRGDELAGIVCTCDLREAQARAPVGRYMSRNVATQRPDATLFEASQRMDQLKVNSLAVPWRGAWGIVTRGDLTRYGVSTRPSCTACGERHHVRRQPRTEPRSAALWFCMDCLDVRQAVDPVDQMYIDVGVGD